MKVAILAGGLGTRLGEETELKPKPMVTIGSQPILWHIMKHYYQYNFKEFVIALGYRGEYIKRWMTDYCPLNSNMTVRMATGDVELHSPDTPDWIVDLVDTGQGTATGGRIKRLKEWVGNETFMLTWGDGVSDIDLDELLKFHKSHGKFATLTAVRPPARFGHLSFKGDQVCQFQEKPQTAEGWINGAFFVLEPEVFDYVEGDATQWELEPLEGLASDGQLMAYKHHGFWQCMDTVRDKKSLESLWSQPNPPWKSWS
ncbi:glucose-1-phosphate cytidylyltransferase [Alkalimarinus coralli]|uniref:glucose-1-phosphate cytidylyltransferase n=1 Tax=Alkalimarinus coralli TaxID=2935863 RepID=UPI00202B822A|nr:glucose-1-phosphate cytidylyltransferase [Alkalimarinus coralli]